MVEVTLIFWYIYLLIIVSFLLIILSALWTWIVAKRYKVPKRIVSESPNSLRSEFGLGIVFGVYGVITMLLTCSTVFGGAGGFIEQCLEDTGAGPLILMLVGPIVIFGAIIIAGLAGVGVGILIAGYLLVHHLISYIHYTLNKISELAVEED